MNFIRWAVRPALAGLLFMAFAAGAFAQSGRLGKIALLPFSGGTPSERDGIAELLGFTTEMMQNFSVIPRTGITAAVRQEQSFQASSGMTNADTIAKLGNQLGADYVMAGSITSLGARKLLIASIIKIDVIRQVAGVYLTYDSLDELNENERILNDMVVELVAMARSEDSSLDKLAVLPVELEDGGNQEEGDALAQLLAIHLLRNGKYAVYPRTRTLDQVQDEYKTQLESGVTRVDEAVRAGEAVNPPYVLSVISRKIGTGNRFNASIIDLEGGYTIAGETEQYTSLSTGIGVMEILAAKLSGKEVSQGSRRALSREENSEARAAEAERRAKARAEASDNFLRKSGINFGGWFALGLGGDAPSENEKRTNDDTGQTETVNVKKAVFSGGGELELLLYRYFGIQTGVSAISDYAAYKPQGGEEEEYEKLTFLQIPILARLNAIWQPEGTDVGVALRFAIYGGVGINASVSTSDAQSAKFSGMNLVIGGELGIGGRYAGMFFGYQYNGSLSDGTYVIDGETYDYSMKVSMIRLGAKIYLPFRK
jgi:TolB-like protein